MNHQPQIVPQKKIENLPTTYIIKYLAPSKASKYNLKGASSITARNKQEVKKPKRNLVDQIIYVAQKLNRNDAKNEQTNSERLTLKQENEVLKTDLKKRSESSQLIDVTPLKSCQDLIQQYLEKDYKIPNFRSDHNLFESNPLIQTEKEIKRFYGNEINKTGYIENLDCYKEKNQNYLLKLQSITNKVRDIKPQATLQHEKTMTMTKQPKRIINPDQPIVLTKTEVKANKKLQIENSKLKIDIDNTMESLHHTATSVNQVNRKQTTPCLKHFKSKQVVFNENINSNNTNSNTLHSINTSTLPSPTNKQLTKKPISTLHKKHTLDAITYRNSFADPNKAFTISITDRINTKINERPRKDAIRELYDFVQKTDYTAYLSCIKHYQKKYQKNKGEYNAPVDKSSQGFTKQLFNHFTHVKNIISNSNERESCSTCYNRIGKKETVESKLLRLEGLDNQLTKFNYFFIKKRINNEKSF